MHVQVQAGERGVDGGSTRTSTAGAAPPVPLTTLLTHRYFTDTYATWGSALSLLPLIALLPLAQSAGALTVRLLPSGPPSPGESGRWAFAGAHPVEHPNPSGDRFLLAAPCGGKATTIEPHQYPMNPCTRSTSPP